MERMVVVDGLEHLRSGKVRDIYAAGPEHLLLVASDRVSTFDAVHPTPVPDKGKVLTGLSAFWFEQILPAKLQLIKFHQKNN